MQNDMSHVTPIQHEKDEWSRMAQAAYHAGRNVIGHRYSVAATLRHDERMAVDRFNMLMADYREWLLYHILPPDET